MYTTLNHAKKILYIFSSTVYSSFNIIAYEKKNCVNIIAYEKKNCVFTPDGPETGDLYLTDTSSGQVHVFLSGMWVPVADSHMNWTHENTKVVCKQLGYITPTGKFV